MRLSSPRFGLALLLSATLSACSVDVKDVPTPVALPDIFSASGQQKAPEQWWLAFNDPALNKLISQALSDNFTLRATYNRLEQAQAIAKKSGAELIPQLNNNNSALQRNSAQTTSRGDIVQSTINTFALGFAASYEIDLWGRIRSNIHASELDVKAAEEDLSSAAISLSAEIASTWYKLLEQEQQLKLLDQQITINQNNVSMVNTRFRLAQATAADVFQQTQFLQSAIGNRLTVLANINVFKNQLAVLIGKAPGTITLAESTPLPNLPGLPDTGLSADLINKRPDLRRAYFRVQASDQRIASAIADRLPKLSLSASIDTNAPDLQSLFNNWLATIAGNLVTPIIDGGRRVAEVERNQAVSAEALNSYATTLLNASKEVENALIQEHQQNQFLSNLDEQVRLAQLATAQIQSRYVNGAIDFLRLLTAQLSQQNLERNRLSAQQQLIDFRINLYRALSGGFPLNYPVTTDKTPTNG
ncbi:MAG: hypothetical protein CTY13_06055 [Methylobacter sp.]|nr:MAG: hypothetical protein CTY13_06055 [Methylobacter sp.]